MYKEHFDAIAAAWSEGNLTGLDEYVATNIVRRGPSTFNSDSNGIDELKQRITEMRTAFPDTTVTIDEWYPLDNRAFCKWTFTGTNTGPGDNPPTGKAVKVSGATFWQLEDNKLVEELVYFDALGFYSQLGVIELPSAAAASG